jgi:Holliday junction DNA helicase RuvA
MIASLRGKLVRKAPTEIVIDIGGVGYAVHIPLSTYEQLGEVDTPQNLLTHLHVREDALQLYGFATEAERHMFRLLISVSGIGPRMAQGILSGASVSDLQTNIMHGNLAALTSIPGIGKKLAERLVVELREKVARKGEAGILSSGPRSGVESEAILALISLGYSRGMAEKAVQQALKAIRGTSCSIEELIKTALRAGAQE